MNKQPNLCNIGLLLERLILVINSPTRTSGHCEMMIVTSVHLEELKGSGNNLFFNPRPPWSLGFPLNSCSELGRMSAILALNSPIIETSSVYISAHIRTYRNMHAHTHTHTQSSHAVQTSGHDPADKLADGSPCLESERDKSHGYLHETSLWDRPLSLHSEAVIWCRIRLLRHLHTNVQLCRAAFNCSYLKFVGSLKYSTCKTWEAPRAP